MRLPIIFLCLTISGALFACTPVSDPTSGSQEPADLTARGKAIAELRKDDWTISEPVTVAEIEAEAIAEVRRHAKLDSRIPMVPFGYVNPEWLAFKARILPADEIRRIANGRAGVGFAIFRNDLLVDMFLPAVV